MRRRPRPIPCADGPRPAGTSSPGAATLAVGLDIGLAAAHAAWAFGAPRRSVERLLATAPSASPLVTSHVPARNPGLAFGRSLLLDCRVRLGLLVQVFAATRSPPGLTGGAVGRCPRAASGRSRGPRVISFLNRLGRGGQRQVCRGRRLRSDDVHLRRGGLDPPAATASSVDSAPGNHPDREETTSTTGLQSRRDDGPRASAWRE